MANWFWQQMRRAAGYESVEEQWARIGAHMDEIRARIDARSPNSQKNIDNWASSGSYTTGGNGGVGIIKSPIDPTEYD
jgi:hypothetical protein